MKNIGVIGCGAVSGYGHLPTLSTSKDWRLVAIADIDAPRLARVHQQYSSATPYTDYRDLLAHPGLDAVVIATHLDTHHRIALDAFSRGLHVLCEKPMATTVEQCREMVTAAARAKRLLAVNFNGRSSSVYRRIKSHIDAGDTGPIRVVRIVYDWSAHQWQPLPRMEAFMRDGGPILDSGVHFFEAARWFTGQDFTHIEAHGVILPPYEAPQHVIASYRLSGGAIALIEAGWLYCRRTKDQGYLYQIDVIGDDGTISHDTFSNTLRVFAKDRTEQVPLHDEDKGFDYVFERFARSIEQGRVLDLASGEDGLAATSAAIDALASSLKNASAPRI